MHGANYKLCTQGRTLVSLQTNTSPLVWGMMSMIKLLRLIFSKKKELQKQHCASSAVKENRPYSAYGMLPFLT